MTKLETISNDLWSTARAFSLAAVALLLGVCGGWLIRRSTAPSAAPHATVVPAPTQPMPVDLGPALLTPQDLKQAADKEAEPLLEQLKTRATDPGLLAQVGNIYYDAKIYPLAIDYYELSLKSQPSDTSVRTDLGTSYWYNGDPDTAIAQLNRALTFEPTKANALFNLGIVKWQGKKDGKGAVEAWQKLLDTNPGYENKTNVLQLIAQAQGH